MNGDPPCDGGAGYARTVVPPWLGGKNPAWFLDRAGLHARQQPDGAWRVRTLESYARRPARLVELHEVSRADSDAWRRAIPKPFGANPLPEVMRSRIPQVDTGQVLGLMNATYLQVVQSGSDQVPVLVGDVVGRLRAFRAEDGSTPCLDATCWMVRSTEQLHFRTKLGQLLAMAQTMPEAQLLKAAPDRSDGPVIQASEGHLQDHYFLESYVAPLLGCVSPYVWGAAVPVHLTGSLVFSYGTALAGRSVLPATLLEMVPARRLTATAQRPLLSADAVPAALAWWTDALNGLLSVASDPVRFVDKAGNYLPMAHLEYLMSLGALFRRVGAAQTSPEHGDAALAMLFSALDVLVSLTGVDLARLCNPEFAAKRLEALTETLPVGVQELLLPGARRAVDALWSVAEGFSWPTPDGRIPAGDGRKPLTRAAAVGSYLHLLRNTTHGFSSPKKGTTPARHQLLARHDGHLSGDLPLAAYLHLLDLLANPSRNPTASARRQR